jgi:hypothetical protein
MGMLEVTCVPAIMEETLIREYTVNLPTSIFLVSRVLGFTVRLIVTVETSKFSESFQL